MAPDPFDRTNLSSFGDATDRAIDRFWDHVAQGRVEDAGGVDPADAATIRHVHRFYDRPDPAKPFVRQLREDLMSTHAIPISSVPRLTLGTASGALPNGRAHRSPPRAPAASARRAPAWARLPLQVVAAALILLIIGLGIVSYIAFWPDNDDRGTTVPAAVGPAASPSPDTTGETLLDVRLPAEAMPYGDKVTGGLNHLTLPADSTATWEEELGSCCPGIRVDYVMSGAYTLQPNIPGWVVRAGQSSLEMVPTGADLTLGPGDTTIFQNEATLRYTNVGEDPAELLFWIVFDGTNGEYSNDPIPAGATIHDSDVRFTLPSIPLAPAVIRLRLVELAPEERLDPPDGSIQFAVTLPVSTSGSPVAANGIATESDGAAVNLGSDADHVYVLTWEHAGSSTPASPTA